MDAGQDKSLWQRDAEMLFVSVLILYLELVLIRWLGTEIRVLAYLSNLILVICFFGVGLGCYWARRPVSLPRLGGNLVVLAVLVGNPLHWEGLDLKLLTGVLSGFEDSLIWQGMVAWKPYYAVGGLVILAGLLYLIAFTFVPAGQILGRAFQEHPRIIRAYSINIAGSLLGVWLFHVMSWRSCPPPVWFVVVAILLVPLSVFAGWRGWLAAGFVALAAVVVWCRAEPGVRTVWSPYQKLALTPYFVGRDSHRVQQGYKLTVNGAGYQHLVNLSDDFLAAHPDLFDKNQARRSYYNLPFQFRRHVRRLLIVGAGTGNNAAAALRHGVEQVDCVEIDPQIYALGKELHPEHPYQSPRVSMIVQDARAFLKQATGHYDLIWFALLDSHTLGSAYNNLRLDHYVYTLESLTEARTLLTDDGVLIVDFDAQRYWMADRLSALLQRVFGSKPLAYRGEGIPDEYGVWSGCTLITGQQPVTLETVGVADIRAFLAGNALQLTGQARLTTDDWPYLYLARAHVPTLHLVTSLTILGTVILARRRGLSLGSGMDWHFVALGAAFLLLEVQTVSRATLLFGMTWVVNAIVISAVLVMILLSNLVAARWPRLPQWFIVTGLAATVSALALVPLDWFNTLAFVPKLIIASAFLTAPVFFSGQIFIRSFAACADKSHALGSNLIGALVGGLLESLSFVTGIRALLLLVGLFYAIALWLRPRLPNQTQARD